MRTKNTQTNRQEKSVKEFICNECQSVFKTKQRVATHVQKCGKSRTENLKCTWCGLTFFARASLTSHSKKMHGVKSLEQIFNKQRALVECEVCKTSFASMFSLKQHIRRFHFNLQARIPYCEQKKVNQVWFEKVQNTDTVMEIKKTGQSSLLMRKLDANTAIKVNENNATTIDLSSLYPIIKRNSVCVICELCNKSISKKEYNKHMQEKHLKIYRFHCNNCKLSFKRPYQYLKHICNKKRTRSVLFNNKKVEIVNVTSLNVVDVS